VNAPIFKNNAAYYFWALILSGLFFLTAYSFTYDQAIIRGFSDVVDYMAVAHAPNLSALTDLSLTHALHRLERWPLHFLMGMMSRSMDIDAWVLEKYCVIAAMGAGLLLVGSLHAGLWQKLALFALLIFSPYTFRQYYAVPGMLADCIFYVAILGLAVGMCGRRWPLMILALCCACFVRQTGILLLPIVAIYCVVEKVDLKKSIYVLALGLGSFLLSKFVSHLVFTPAPGSYVVMHTLGIFFWMADEPHWFDLVDFLGRYGLMLLSLSPILMLVNRLSRRDWMYIAFFFFLHTQPLMAGPAVSGSNVDRLAIYGLPFLALLLLGGSNQAKLVGLFIALIFVESLLPNFSILHGMAYPRIFFVSAVLLATVISLWIRGDRFGKLAL